MKTFPTRLDEPFEKTIDEVVQEKLKLLALQDGDVLVDLGCGDARNLIAATKLADIQCIGYEILPKALEAATKNIEDAGLADRIEIIEKDFLRADLSNANALILYLTRNSLGKLSGKLENELPKGTRIVTHDFDIPGWTAEKVIDFQSKEAFLFTFYVYCVQ
ncbi:ribosomal protein L11 methyltransferase [Kordia sp. SMS9]|uniref:SAM-dependent methyltransferase n=1 Tax=Kordia sp. SMS9 TaxID=2282170 RepID=UPI000E0D44D3|nr:methyltransferase domain-containing protein [Kordia sp. SMS9]AXG69715.1 ribosomal protein L11 methyltransferase [Kordia sp. SMS9]